MRAPVKLSCRRIVGLWATVAAGIGAASAWGAVPGASGGPGLANARSALPMAQVLPLPGGEGGIGFDDLLYSRELGKVLVPAGRSGRLDLVDPKTHAVSAVSGFSAEGRFGGGHGEGTTSADTGAGLIFASDRTLRGIIIVDPKAQKPVGRSALRAGPDYVRWVGPNGEVWVTEPRAKSIEVLKLSSQPPTLQHVLDIPVPEGPESLIVDRTRGRAYTHSWHGTTFAIDLKSHQVVARWANGCEGARGIALDEAQGLLFVGCDEGKATVLDVTHDGRRLGSASSGKGVDIIAYSPKLRHLYLPGGDSATMAVIEVAANGSLELLGTVPTAEDAHCVAADDRGGVYVCDPRKGQLLIFEDGPRSPAH